MQIFSKTELFILTFISTVLTVMILWGDITRPVNGFFDPNTTTIQEAPDGH